MRIKKIFLKVEIFSQEYFVFVPTIRHVIDKISFPITSMHLSSKFAPHVLK